MFGDLFLCLGMSVDRRELDRGIMDPRLARSDPPSTGAPALKHRERRISRRGHELGRAPQLGLDPGAQNRGVRQALGDARDGALQLSCLAAQVAGNELLEGLDALDGGGVEILLADRAGRVRVRECEAGCLGIPPGRESHLAPRLLSRPFQALFGERVIGDLALGCRDVIELPAKVAQLGEQPGGRGRVGVTELLRHRSRRACLGAGGVLELPGLVGGDRRRPRVEQVELGGLFRAERQILEQRVGVRCPA